MEIFKELIKPLKSVLIKDVLASILKDEVANQCNIARLDETANWVEQNIYFNVYSNKIDNVDAAEMPSVLIFPSKIIFDEATQSLEHADAIVEICIEMYTAATYGKCKNGDKVPADKNALSRLNYMSSQVLGILMSQSAESIRAKNHIRSMTVKEWQMLRPKKNGAEFIAGARFIFKVEVSEVFETLKGSQLKELYINLSVQDELVTTILKNTFENNGG